MAASSPQLSRERERCRNEIATWLMKLAPLSGIKSLENPDTVLAKAAAREKDAWDASGGDIRLYGTKIKQDISVLRDRWTVLSSQAAQAQPPPKVPASLPPPAHPQPHAMSSYYATQPSHGQLLPSGGPKAPPNIMVAATNAKVVPLAAPQQQQQQPLTQRPVSLTTPHQHAELQHHHHAQQQPPLVHRPLSGAPLKVAPLPQGYTQPPPTMNATYNVSSQGTVMAGNRTPNVLEEVRLKFDELRTSCWPQLEATAKKAMQFKQQPPPNATPEILNLLSRLIQVHKYVQSPFPGNPDPQFIDDIQKAYDVVQKQKKTAPTPQQASSATLGSRPTHLQPVTVAAGVKPATTQPIVIDDSATMDIKSGSLLTAPQLAGAKATSAASRTPAKASASPLPTTTVAGSGIPSMTTVSPAQTQTSGTQIGSSAQSASPQPNGTWPAGNNQPTAAKRQIEEISLAEVSSDLLKEVERGLPDGIVAVLHQDLVQSSRGRLTPYLVKSLLMNTKESNNLFWWEAPTSRVARKRSISEISEVTPSDDVIQARTLTMDAIPTIKRQKRSGFSAWDLLEDAKAALVSACRNDAVLKDVAELDDVTLVVEHEIPSAQNTQTPPRLVINFRQPDDAAPILVDPENPSLAFLAPSFRVENLEFPGLFFAATKTRVDELHKLRATPASIALDILQLWKSYIQALSTISNAMNHDMFREVRLTESTFRDAPAILLEFPGIPSLHVGIPVDYPKSSIKTLHINMPPRPSLSESQKRDLFIARIKEHFPHPLEKIVSIWLSSFRT